MYTIYRLIYVILEIQFFCKSRQSVHIMYTISRRIYHILDIQFFCKSKHSVHITYTITRWIYTIQDIQFFCKSKPFVHLLTQFVVEFTLFWIFNFSANLDNPYVQCTQFPLKFMLFLYSIFLQIQTIYVYNVHNFSLNLRNFGCSIF